MYYRHGDLSFHPVDEQKGLEEIQFNGEYILALGEATGHAHRLVADRPDVKIFRDAQGQIFLFIQGKAVVTHEEHKKITLTPGWYRVGHEQEYDYFENSVQNVID